MENEIDDRIVDNSSKVKNIENIEENTRKEQSNNKEIINNTININETSTFSNSKLKIKINTNGSKKKYFSIKKTKHILGRKRKNTLYFRKKGEHAKDSYDNMTRKIKYRVISSLIKCINEKFNKINSENKVIKLKLKLYTIKGTQSNNITLQYNKDLLKKKIYEILSDDISGKVKIKNEKNNHDIIKSIMEENKYDDIKDIKDIKNILELTFLECINHFIRKEMKDCLNGFENYYTSEKMNSIKDHKEKFEDFVNNIEKYFNDKEFRKEKNKNKNQ
jgi:hypothetical protein